MSASHRRVRTRIAVGMTATALGVAALVAVAATALSAWLASDPQSETRTGAARVGDDVAFVVVTDQGADDAAAQARRDTLEWTLIALGVALVPAVGLGWFAAGRMLGAVDRALAATDAAETARRRRLQEVVHELRTPLAVAGTNLELARTGPDLDAESRDLIDAARRAVDRMGRTVDDLATGGQLAVLAEPDPVDLGVVAHAVAAEHSGPARARIVRVEVTRPDTPVAAVADRDAVRTVLSNLVGNAVRLAPAGSAVHLAVGADQQWAWIAVTDEGPGLPQRLHARVFERGWQGPHDRAQRATERDGHSGGAQHGLGLAIARQLTEAHGGRLTLESTEGVGATFTVWLPLTDEADPTDVVERDAIHPRRHPWRAAVPAGV